MKKLKILGLFFVLTLSICTMFACSQNSGGQNQSEKQSAIDTNQISVIVDGQIYTAIKGERLQKPTENPTRKPTLQYEYIFSHWEIEGTNVKWDFDTDVVTEEMIIIPVFSRQIRKYTVIVENVNDTKTYQLEYGDKVPAPDETPYKPDSEYETFTFDFWGVSETKKWDFEKDSVNASVTIRPYFISETKPFTTDLICNIKPYEINIGGQNYCLNDFNIDYSEVEFSIINVKTQQETPIELTSGQKTIEVKSGKNILVAKYKNNITKKLINIQSENPSIDLYLSDAYLGGSVTGNGQTYYSYKNSSVSDLSGNGWTLIDNQRDSVSMNSYTYVYYNDLYASEYYAECVFDTSTVPSYNLNSSDFFTGILIASKHVDLDGAGKSDDDKMKIIVGLYGKSIVLCKTNAWSATNTVTIANYSQLLKGDYDKANVKLGVLRSGTTYSFFVNDTFIAKREIKDIDNACGVGVANLSNESSITKFNASTNPNLISALKAESKDLPKTIDIYIIAGQSNASGYSTFDNKTMLNLDDSLVYGNNNIWYSGRAQWTRGSSIAVNEYDWGLARVGQGRINTCLGAEAGMSTVLKQYYNTDSNRIAGIIKLAHGGTALTNNTQTGESGVGGNWTSPTYAKVKGYNYTGLCGKLYRDLLNQVEQRINELKEMGFTEINIKGIWWSQGAADKNNVKEYPIALEYFINDIRADLGKLMNTDLSDLAFVISEISRSTGGAWDSTVTTNTTFMQMQDDFASSHDNVYIEKNGYIDVNVMKDGVSVAIGTDEYHWKQGDAVTVGQMAGELILNEILNYNK